ncbi:MAG: hypothetical protein AB7S26_38080 [Sandaracinaceae bacterium]
MEAVRVDAAEAGVAGHVERGALPDSARQANEDIIHATVRAVWALAPVPATRARRLRTAVFKHVLARVGRRVVKEPNEIRCQVFARSRGTRDTRSGEHLIEDQLTFLDRSERRLDKTLKWNPHVHVVIDAIVDAEIRRDVRDAALRLELASCSEKLTT